MAQLGLDYPTAWGRRYSARIARDLYQRFFVSPVILHLTTLDVRGTERITGPGPFIFAANHSSNLDTPILLTALPTALRRRTVVAAAMDNFFMDSGKAFRTTLCFNAIPIDRHKINRRSSQLALDLVQDGWNLLIYPEGGRTPDGQLQEFKGGAAYLADRAHADVVPIYIHEAGYVQAPKYAKAPKYRDAPRERRHHVVVAFGAPLHCEAGENIRRFNTRIENAVVALGREVSGDPTYDIKRATS